MMNSANQDYNYTEEKITEIKNTMDYLNKKFPRIMESFYKSFVRIDNPSALSKKTKRLISLGGALIKNCDWCIIYYVNKCLEEGATPNEIIEASMVVIKMNGNPGLMQMTLVLQTLKDLGKLE